MSSAVLELSPQEIDAILNEEDYGLLTTKERKRLERTTRKPAQQSKENVSQYSGKFKTKKLEPKTERQKLLINAITQYEEVFVTGPAGTGKTYVACGCAAQMLGDKQVDKLVLTRPNVPAGRSLGFFPGDMNEKMANWVVPLMHSLRQTMNVSDSFMDLLIKRGKIEVIPFETIRGRSLENSFILLDEAQNTTVQEMKAFLTRSGENSKIVINGDLEQSDIDAESGLYFALNMVKKSKTLSNKVAHVHFEIEDIVRSDLCADWVRAFSSQGGDDLLDGIKRTLRRGN